MPLGELKRYLRGPLRGRGRGRETKKGEEGREKERGRGGREREGREGEGRK